MGRQMTRDGLEHDMGIELKNTVYREGEGIPVVLVHGFPVDHRMWDQCAAALARICDEHGMTRFPIWAPDMPGAGEGPIPSDEASGGKDADGTFPHALDRMADAYVDMIREAGHEKAIWVGLSMGGYLILDIQRLHPEAVAGLALCDTKGDADSAAMRGRRIAIADECEATGTHDPVMGFAVANETDSSIKQSAEYARQFTLWINEQPAAGIAWRERMAAGRPDLNDVLAKVSAPSAVICGDKDPSSPPEVMGPVADAMTGTTADFTVISDCGHFSAYEHPEAVAEALRQLVRRIQ